MKADVSVDARDLLGPLPLIGARKAMSSMSKGQVLELITSDPAALDDVLELQKRMGYEIVGTEERGELLLIYIKMK